MNTLLYRRSLLKVQTSVKAHSGPENSKRDHLDQSLVSVKSFPGDFASTVSKYSTNTLSASDTVVPWLAAEGPLAYTPDNPPERDYYFQYGWVLPQVLSVQGDRNRHRFFGAGPKESAAEVFAFWEDARRGLQVPVHVKEGTVAVAHDRLETPIGVYLQRKPSHWLTVPPIC